MSRIILYDEDFETTIHCSESEDEELFDLLEALVGAYKDGGSYAEAISSVIGSDLRPPA